MGLTYKTEQPDQIVFAVLYEISHTPYISRLFVCLKRNLLVRDHFKEAKTLRYSTYGVERFTKIQCLHE